MVSCLKMPAHDNVRQHLYKQLFSFEETVGEVDVDPDDAARAADVGVTGVDGTTDCTDD